MLSSRFLAVGFLYIFYTTGLVAADPRNPFGGGDQFCQSVRTVTVTKTVVPGQPSPSSRPANGANSASLPVLTTRPGNVNLGNGAISTSVVKSTKTSSSSVNTITSSINNGNTNSRGNVDTKTKGGNTNTKSGSINTKSGNTNTKSGNVNTKSGNTNTKSGNTNTKGGNNSTKNGNNSTKNGNNNTKNGNTKTSSVIPSSTPLPTTSLPPISTTGRPPAVSSSSTAAPPANTGTGNNGNNGNTGNTGNPATSLTLDPSIIQNINGKGQAAGEADSLLSPNNFIGFCVGKTLTNGKQVQAGSCNPVPMGDIPSVDNMPSAKFNSFKNFDTIAANTPFTISLQVRNLVTGTFTNAANTYYAAPQQLVNGAIQGHSHVTVQKMTSLDSPEPLNPRIFDFFKGLNAVARNGILTADVTKGLPVGIYRISSINSAGNHQEALGPVAQRGSFNDAIYITVTEDGQGANAVSSVVLPSSSGISSSVVNPASSVLPVSSPVVDPTATGLPTGVSSDVLSPTIPLPAVSSTPPAVPSSTGKGGKGGKNTVSSSELPVSTSTGGKKGGKGGNVVSTPVAPPKSTTPAAGDGKKDAKNPTVSSSASLPGPTSTQGVDGKGGKGPQNSDKQNPKRMHKRSRRA